MCCWTNLAEVQGNMLNWKAITKLNCLNATKASIYGSSLKRETRKHTKSNWVNVTKSVASRTSHIVEIGIRF